MNWFHLFVFCDTKKLLKLYKNTPHNKHFASGEGGGGGGGGGGGKDFVALLTALSKFARKTVLKINWSVKTT